MPLSCNFFRPIALAGFAVLMASPSRAATSQADRETQMLANFPALQRLSAAHNEAAIHAYLVRVAKSYQAAGYKTFARELPQADRLVALFGAPDREKDASTLALGRKTLRDLEQALGKNAFLALPVSTGKNVPDYFDIGRAFLGNAQGALKNLSQGKNVGHSLGKRAATFWVNKQDGHTWQVVSTNAGVTVTVTFTPTEGGTLNLSSGSSGRTTTFEAAIDTGGGTLTLAGTNTYTGSTTISGGTLDLGTAAVGLEGNAAILQGAPLAITGLIKTGTGTLTLSNGEFYTGNTVVGSGNLDIAGGTLGTGVITIITRGSLTVTSGTVFLPEINFADATESVHLAGGNLTVTGTTGTHWIALASGAALPDGQCGAFYFIFDAPYTVNNVDLPTGTEIFRVNDGFLTPDGATELPDAGLTAVSTATPTPSPSPSPTP